MSPTDDDFDLEAFRARIEGYRTFVRRLIPILMLLEVTIMVIVIRSGQWTFAIGPFFALCVLGLSRYAHGRLPRFMR